MSAYNISGLVNVVLVAAWVEWAIDTILIYARFHTNAFIVHHFRSDFWWALSAYVHRYSSSSRYPVALTLDKVSRTLATISSTVSVYWGLARHIHDLTPTQISKNQFWYTLCITFTLVGISLGKIAIIAFILQIEGRSLKPYRKRFLYFLAITNTILIVAIIPVIWIQCIPAQAIWDVSVVGDCNGRRRNKLLSYFVGSMNSFIIHPLQEIVANIVTLLGYGTTVDFALSIYPMIVFWHLAIDVHTKLGLCALFTGGMV